VRTLWLAWLLVSLCAFTLTTLNAALPEQIIKPKRPSEAFLTASFEVNNLDRMDAILVLSRRYRIPLGIEFVDEAMFQPVSVRVPSGDTIKSALEQLAPSKNGFIVTDHENVFVISHQNVPTTDNVLDTILDEVKVPGDSIQMANWTVVVALDREDRKVTGIPQSQGYGISIAGVQSSSIAPFTATKTSVRDVLDRIVGEDGNAAWIVQVRPAGLLRKQAKRLDSLWTVVDYETGPVDGISQITRHAIGEGTGKGSH
jgi:hypothetical protein